MPPPLILDPARLDLSCLVADVAEIERTNPHRHEFRLLDGVVYLDIEQAICAGYYDVRPDAFWVRGHIPGRPLLPGVLMIEAAAQLSSFAYQKVAKTGRFMGFTGVDNVKFRGVVQPPCRLVIVAHGVQMKPRRMICETQAFVDGTMVYEGVITGMPV